MPKEARWGAQPGATLCRLSPTFEASPDAMGESPRRMSRAEGSFPRWHVPGRAHVHPPYENQIDRRLGDFYQNTAKKARASPTMSGGGRRHFPAIATPAQREPQLW